MAHLARSRRCSDREGINFTLEIMNKFDLYNYSKTDMDEYHQHIYDSFGETDWQIIMYAFIDTVCYDKSDKDAKNLIDEFIYQMIQGHYNT